MKPQKHMGVFFLLVCVYLTVGFKTNCELKNKGYYKLNIESDPLNNATDSVIVSGKIFDLKTKEPLAAILTAKDTKIGCVANQNGYFEKKIKIGTYNFIFSFVGNTTLTTKKIKLKKGVKYNFDVYLDSQIIYSKDH
ncbi:MAG: carboxypeptidase-like regulatory domain-containing protein [Bacteroidota bacterium]|nr:carboxypeptidase-like regulatory domain-containing protein [Bacteroidota bacterium]